MESFWDFSVRTYRTDGVPDACLALQNEHGVDVNMLLYCCWAAQRSGAMEDELFVAASRWSERWAGPVVIPLREARTWMKHTGCVEEPAPRDACMKLRDQVKSVEFAAEKLQQAVLESLLQTPGNVDPKNLEGHVTGNLRRYLAHIGVEETEEVRDKLQTIIAAAFPVRSDPLDRRE